MKPEDGDNWIPGMSRSFSITSDELKRAEDAKTGLLLSLGLEEKFNLLVENYREYETELLDLTVRYMLYPHLDWSQFISETQLVNRRLLNMLSAFRLYVDHGPHDLKVLLGEDSHDFEIIKRATNDAYDGRLGYRVLSEVRNHIQHRALPVSEVRHESYLPDGDSHVRFRVIPLLTLRDLQEDPHFKKNVITDLIAHQSKTGTVNLTPLVRDLLEGAAAVQAVVRRTLEPLTTKWDSLFLDLLKRAEAEFGELPAGLVFVSSDVDGHDGRTQLFDGLTSRRKELSWKNSRLESVSRQFVTSEAHLNDS